MLPPEQGQRPQSLTWWVWVLSALVPVVGAASTLAFLDRSMAPVQWVLGAALALALLSLLSTPGGSPQGFSPASMVVAFIPVIASENDRIFDTAGAYAVLATGAGLGWVLRTARGDDQRLVLTGILRSSLGFVAYVACFYALWQWGASEAFGDWRAFVLVVLAAAAAFAVEVVASGVLRPRFRGESLRYRMLLTLHESSVFVALMATGSLFGLAFEEFGWWALLVAALPYAFAHGAFRRFAAAQRTYAQTIRALAQIPEVGGHRDPGHSQRTADLAVSVALELGLFPTEVEHVEYCALMHDIGRVSLNEPSVAQMGYTENDIARWGAEIVGETAYLRKVAEVVQKQFDPYRHPGEEKDFDLPIAARIVKVCSAYDEATAELGNSPLEAIERLHRGSAYDYDPDVVAALRRVAERNGLAGHPLSRT